MVTPVYNVEKKWLEKAIDSVLNQRYSGWELCIADDGSTKPHVRFTLGSYAEKDQRVKVRYLKDNQGIAAATNAALSMATGRYIAFLDHDDELHPESLWEIARFLDMHPDTDLIYTDEDKIDLEGRHSEPVIKPGWCPELFLTYNYLCHLVVCRKEVIDKAGRFRKGFDGSQDYDMLLRVTEQTDKIRHIPKILYHWRKLPGSAAYRVDAKKYAFEMSRKALQEAMTRRGIRAKVTNGSAIGHFRIKQKRRHNLLLSGETVFSGGFFSALNKRTRSWLKQKSRKRDSGKNLQMRNIYTEFLAAKEQERVFMLKRKDLYESGPPNSLVSPEMMALIKKHGGKKILDIGCGNGIYSRELGKMGFSCTGIEISDENLQTAEKYINALSNAAEKLDFADNSFDTVILLEVLEHLNDPFSALGEISRVTRKNLILSVPNLGPLPECVENNVIMHHFFETTHMNFFTKSMLERLLKGYFPYVRVTEFAEFFQISGKKLYYHLAALASFEEL